MTVWLVRHAVDGAKVDAARHWLSGGIVDDNRLDPVSSSLHPRHAHAVRLDDLLLQDVAPLDAVDEVRFRANLQGGGWDGSDVRIHWTGGDVVGFAPAGERVLEKCLGGVLR